MRERRWYVAAFFAGVGVACAVLLFWLTGSMREPAEPPWMQLVERAHRVADEAPPGAGSEHVERALIDAFEAVPERVAPPERWVRQDLCARLSELNLRNGRAQEALVWAERGLLISGELSIVRAELLGLQGNALEALGQKEEAAGALHEALKANQKLMERVLDGDTLERPPR